MFLLLVQIGAIGRWLGSQMLSLVNSTNYWTVLKLCGRSLAAVCPDRVHANAEAGRLTGDLPRHLLDEPRWISNKTRKRVLTWTSDGTTCHKEKDKQPRRARLQAEVVCERQKRHGELEDNRESNRKSS